MDQIFANLQKDGKTDVDSLIKWMKDSNVISESQEEKARTLFNAAPDQANITLDQFKDVLMKLAADMDIDFDGIADQLSEHIPEELHGVTEDAASALTSFLAKVINQTKEQEEKVRSYFSDVADKKNVTLDKFKEVIEKVADEFKVNLDGVTKKLAETGPTLLQTAVDGATSTLRCFMKDLIPKSK